MNLEFTIDRELLKKIIKSHKKFIECSTQSLLRCFHFKLLQNTLKVYSTDGTRFLQSTFTVNNVLKKDGDFNIDALAIKNLVVLTATDPNIQVAVNSDSVAFIDVTTGIIQKYVNMAGIYPDMDELLNTFEYKEYTIKKRFDKTFFKELEILLSDKYAQSIEISLHKEDSLKPLIAKTKSDNLEQTALLLPMG